MQLDQQRHKPKLQFISTYSNYQITANIIGDPQYLEILVQNNDSLDQYQRHVDQQFIKNQQNFFQSYFQDPQDLYDTIKIQSKDIFIENDSLKFNYVYGVNKKVKLITIPLIKIEMNQTKLKQKIKELKNTLVDKENQNKILLLKLDEVIKQRQILQARSQAFQRRYIQEKQNSNKIRRQMQNVLSEYNQLIKSLQSKTPQYDPKIPIKVQIIYNEKIKQSKLDSLLKNNESNPHSIYYNIIDIEDRRKIQRIGAGGWYSFINQYQIIPNQISKYSVKIIKLTNRNMMIGICTEKGYGIYGNHLNLPQSIYYFCSGSYYEAGSNKPVGISSGNNDIIDCIIDMTKQKLYWNKNGKQMISCQFPQGLKGKKLYFSIEMYNAGDQVQIIF